MRCVIAVGMFAGALGCGAEPVAVAPAPEPVAIAVTGAEVEAVEPAPEPEVSEEVVEEQPASVSELALATGFTPDPAVVRGDAGGPVDASRWHPSCQGWVSADPNLELHLTTSFSRLRVLVSGGAHDLTIVMQKPDGSFLCNDDAEGHDPILDARLQAGRHAIWVGTYDANQPGADYLMALTELQSVTTGGLRPGGATGGIRLASGFVPDPHIVRGTGGGSRDASTLGSGCAGWIGDAPDHTFVATSLFSQLRFLVLAQLDATLVVRLEDGRMLCADDVEGTNPVVSAAIPAGSHSIWVGAKNPGQPVEYALGITELTSVTTASLRP